MSIIFTIWGKLPEPWEDFITNDPKLSPSFTIMTRTEADRDIDDTADDEESSTDWLEIVLDVPEITEDLAKAAIAEAIGVPVESIVIEQKGTAQSI